MINRFLGIDNCIGCDKLRKLFGELKCTEYKKIIKTNCFSIPIKLSCCNKPFKYDLSDENIEDDKIVG